MIPFDKLPELRPQVHICTKENPWNPNREPQVNEEVCHPDAQPWSKHLNIFKCPHCKGYFRQERP